jgi:molybdopterin synthase catalytic subunit
MICLEKNKLDLQKIQSRNVSLNNSVGAAVTFIGYVRDFSEIIKDNKKYIEIEYYDGMTQKAISYIEKNAQKKWNLIDILIMHRVGIVHLSEPIVYISVSSKHRSEAFDACKYIIDYLKVQAPFWKKEVAGNKSKWVEQKKSDFKNLDNFDRKT